MERLTAFNNGIWGISTRAVADGYDRYSLFSRLAEYENIGLTPQNIICREDDIRLLQKQNKEFREEINRLHTLVEQQGKELNRRDEIIRELDKKCDYWERESKRYCAQLGEIRILAGQELCDE